MNTVFIVSDGTGGTAHRALNAALTQFKNIPVHIELRAGTRTKTAINTILSEAASSKGFVVHTLVSNSLRDYMLKHAREQNVETIDLMGPLLFRLSEQLSLSPLEKPGLFRQLNEDYFRRIETMEFALDHDDGVRSNNLLAAEIILVGVSRTFKTPLSVYLAFKGWFVANIPIIMSMEPPAILKQLPPTRVIGLTMNARRLVTLRTSRSEYLHGAVQDYIDLDSVRSELLYALHYFNTAPAWNVIDVTGKPIEGIAAEIIGLVGAPL